MSAALCIACNAKPKYNDGTKTHPYCGRTCAAKMKNMCEMCHAKPKHVDGTKTHPYCSKACAARMKTMCQLCRQQPRYDDGQTTHLFCSRTCARQAKSSCLVCGSAATRGHFCSRTCGSKATKNAPQLLGIHSGHDTFKSIVGQFETSWRHQTPCPTVRRVYKIVGDRASISRYEKYRASVEARGNFAATGRSPGNENRRWHGTTRKCLLGDNGNTTFCSSSSCSLCNIIRTSYRLDRSGSKFSFSRFGKGIYTSSTSSKSNDYSDNTVPSTQKALLLNKVIVGRGYKITTDSPNLAGPPPGYDSVLGEVVIGGSLNHDELICYTEKAIRPSYLVIYDA